MSAAIAAGDPQTVDAAAAILEAGGNAVDAIVAAALASFVCEPLLASAGGAGVLTLWHQGEAHALDFFPRMPAQPLPADPEFVEVPIDFGSTVQRFHVGRASAAAPTALEGLAAAHARFGRIPLKNIVEPAKTLARDGAYVTASTANIFSILWPINTRLPETARSYSRDGAPPREGSRLFFPAFVEILDAFAREGRTPEVMRARVLAEFGLAAGGALTAEDLALATPRWSPPRVFSLGEAQIITSPRIGGALVDHIATRLAAIQAPSQERELVAIAEACRSGDARRRDSLLGGTTHMSVIDHEGSAASMTLTNGEGCGVMISGTGIQMNNFLGEADLHPGGFFSAPPKALMPTMVAPTIARCGDRLIALGSGGANRIRSVVSQVLWRLIVRGEPLREAIAAPRVHAEVEAGGSVWFESLDPAMRSAEQEALSAAFEVISTFPERAFYFGGVHVASRAGDRAEALGDPRRGGDGRTL